MFLFSQRLKSSGNRITGYVIDPVDSHRMFLAAIHRYLIWSALAALGLAMLLNYLLTRRLLRPSSR